MEAFQFAYKQKPAFIIHMGDLVDLALKQEYDRLAQIFTMEQDIPIYTVPGNHEAFQGNLDFYREMFGSPTYHFYYGETLFVFLNSAFEQSITASDSTQFSYLRRLLANHKNADVIIVTHVPTKDKFWNGTPNGAERR